MKPFRNFFRFEEFGLNDRAVKHWLVSIFLIGIVLRIGALTFIGEARVPWQLEFEEIANNLVEHGQYYFSFYGLTDLRPTSFIPPVYPLLLALAESLWGGHGDWLVKGIQILASSSVVFGLYALTRELGGSAPQGMLAAFFWAIYPPAVAYASDLSTVTLEIFFIIIGIWLLMRAVKRHLPDLTIPAGILLSLAALTRSPWLVVLPLAVLWMLIYYPKGGLKVWGKPACFFCLAAALTLAPWVIYNYQAQGTWLLSSTNGGLNFWIGNNPQATGEYVFPTVMDRELVLAVADWDEPARDHFFYEQGLDFIKNSPGEYFSLLGHKLIYALLFRPNIGSNYEAAQIPIFNLVVLLFVGAWLALIPFALIGLFNLGARWREHSLLVLVFLGNVIPSVLYFTGTRFRTPVEGFVIIWAAIGLTMLVYKWRQRRFSRGLVPGQGK